MDFKGLISKINSIAGVEEKAAPKAKEPIRLDEDTEFKVLAGLVPLTESVIAEKAVSKSQQQAAGAALAAKRKGTTKGLKGSSKEMSKMSTKELEKFAGTKHKGLPKKKTSESVEIDVEEFKMDFENKVREAIDVKTIQAAQAHSEKNPSKKDAESDANVKKKYGYRGPDGSEVKDKKASTSQGRGRKKTTEGAKPDFLDIDKDGDKKEPMKKAAAEKGGDKKDAGKKGMTAAQKKLPPGLQKAIAKKKGKTESVQTAKKMVSESRLSFEDAVKMVRESGGQQRIDPIDSTLWSWATRVAANKFQGSRKAELYAGLVYERAGGRFEIYDVLSEQKKK